MATDWNARIRDLTSFTPARAAGEIAALTDEALAGWYAHELDEPEVEALRALLVRIVGSGEGSARERTQVGVLLGYLGDPRLRMPEDADYWVRLTQGSGDSFDLGRFPVTNAEYRRWTEAGGYRDRAAWSDEGWAWLRTEPVPWPELAVREEAADFVVPNQPVVGVSWFEAEAFARAHGARLPRWYERVFAVRGAEKRPYPWGDPFGEGHANTKEEVLGRTVAVGLFVADVTPEGVHDLAGNAAEWTAEKAGEDYLLHPGSYEQPGLAAWAKALTSAAPSARWSALGFRLARDAG
jgi:hypothetical protein